FLCLSEVSYAALLSLSIALQNIFIRYLTMHFNNSKHCIYFYHYGRPYVEMKCYVLSNAFGSIVNRYYLVVRLDLITRALVIPPNGGQCSLVAWHFAFYN